MKNQTVIRLLLLSVLPVILAAPLSGCGVVRSGANEYDELVALVQNVQASAANFQLVTDTQYAKIQAKTQITENYYEAVAESGEVWTGNFREEAEAMAGLLEEYQATSGGDTQLNLAELQNNGLLPDSLGEGFNLYVNAVVQAPPPVPDPEVTLSLGDTIDEGMNTVQLAGTDWNDAVREYNTRRSQIKGEIVSQVSEYFGFELPVAFPYYQGGNTGPVTNPLSTE